MKPRSDARSPLSAARPETDSNYATLLPWWDRLFGTYRAQPEAGHAEMSVGLERFREARDLYLDRVLWLLPMAGLAAASFAVPHLGLTPDESGLALLGLMGTIAAVVLFISPSVCSFLLNAGLIFERFFDRIAGLLIPAFAFLTFYSLLVIVFACVYRILVLYLPGPHFNFNGSPYEINFTDSLYFSIVTLSTLGYGAVAPIPTREQVLEWLQN